MEPKAMCPQEVVVQALPPTEGLAVILVFEMSRKNHFNYMVFLDSNGSASVSPFYSPTT